MRTATEERAVTGLYERLIRGWNARDASEFAAAFAADGVVIGYDGSEQAGQERIAVEMDRIFDEHETAAYVAKVRHVERVGTGAAILHAVVGMVPPGASDLDPERNAHQTAVARRGEDGWRILFFQNTPAQFHGRPDLADALTAELRAAWANGEAVA